MYKWSNKWQCLWNRLEWKQIMYIWPGSLQWALQPRQWILTDCRWVCKSYPSGVANLQTLIEFCSFYRVLFEVFLSFVYIVHVLSQVPNATLQDVANHASVQRWNRLPLSNHWECGSNKQLAIRNWRGMVCLHSNHQCIYEKHQNFWHSPPLVGPIPFSSVLWVNVALLCIGNRIDYGPRTVLSIPKGPLHLFLPMSSIHMVRLQRSLVSRATTRFVTASIECCKPLDSLSAGSWSP